MTWIGFADVPGRPWSPLRPLARNLMMPRSPSHGQAQCPAVHCQWFDSDIWKVALYDIIYDIISLWYWLWYHMFWIVFDILFLWYHTMSMISWFYIYDIIPLLRMISVTYDINNQYHMQNHIWYHGIKSIYDIILLNLWYQ